MMPDADLPSVASAGGGLAGLREDAEAARAYAKAGRAESTRRVYASDWRRWIAWCASRGVQPLPADPAAVALFCAHEAASGIAPPTITRRLSAIGAAHQAAGHPPPQLAVGGGAISAVMGGIRRSRGAAPSKKAAANSNVVRDLLRVCTGDDLRAMRARALILVGMAGAFRRSELVAIRVEDLQRDAEGIRVVIWRSKVDQEGEGAIVAIPHGDRLRPVASLDAWLTAAGVTNGYLFRRLSRSGRVTDDPMSSHAVGRLVQAAAAAAGYDPKAFGGHSLRAGFVTSAARAGASVWKIREVTRHKSLEVLGGYVRDAQVYRDHAGSGFL